MWDVLLVFVCYITYKVCVLDLFLIAILPLFTKPHVRLHIFVIGRNMKQIKKLNDNNIIDVT